MPNTQKINFEKNIMNKVNSNEITMKPRWYFVLGYSISIAGLIGIGIGAVYMTNLTLFLLRKHGPMGEARVQVLLQSFPWWIPILAVMGIVIGILMLRKYEFSYKKNFGLIVAAFIAAIIIAAVIIDFSGLNDLWSRGGPMRGFYQQISGPNSTFQNGTRQGRRWLGN